MIRVPTTGPDRPKVPGWVAPDARNGWRVDIVGEDGTRYVHHARKLLAIVSACVEEDGKPWVHFSLSHRTRIPSWGELRTAKEEFLGDVAAYQVLPTKDCYVNLHPHVLHLWVCLDGPILPEFSGLTPSGTRTL